MASMVIFYTDALSENTSDLIMLPRCWLLKLIPQPFIFSYMLIHAS